MSQLLHRLVLSVLPQAAAHVTHAFQTARGTRKERAAKALADLGPSVFKGGFSTIAGIACLGAAVTYVFQVFFRYLMTILVMSLWCGLCQAPVLLALLGPAERPDETTIANAREGGNEDNLGLGKMGTKNPAIIAMTTPSVGDHKEEKESATPEGNVAV